MSIIPNKEIQDLIIDIRGEKVILDSDVANIYGVETKRVNEAVKNIPDRFPEGYIIQTTEAELNDLRSKFSTTKFSMTRSAPKALTEKY